MAQAVLALAPLCAMAAGDDESSASWKFSGYYKNLLVGSQTVVPPAGERYTEDMNRLRLKIEGQPAEHLALDLQYDNEIQLGDYLQTQQFQLQKALPPQTYWNLQDTYAQSSDYYAQQSLYRTVLTWSNDATDVRFGRQRIALGTGRFFSALDILNPLSPVTLERDERVGVDALLVEHKLDALSRVSAFYAPDHDASQSTVAALWHANRHNFDFSFVAGRLQGEHMVGVDLAGPVGDAGIRGELTHSRRADGSWYTRALGGLDYAFANTLVLSGELYYDGAGASDPKDYDFRALFAGRVRNVGRHYVALHAGYDITPLLKVGGDFVANLGDHSHYASPSLTYSIETNLDVTLGVQLFTGSTGSEYGTLKDTAFAELQWFF
jgi:hypothetical protein